MLFINKGLTTSLVLIVLLGGRVSLAETYSGKDSSQPGMPGMAPSSTPTVVPSITPSPVVSPSSSPIEAAAAEVMVRIPQGSVGMGPAAYGVNPLVVTTGTTVTWINDDSAPHTATSDTQVWDSGTLNTGERFSFKFDTPGTFPYFCTIHGQASMSGVIQVNN